MSNNETYELFVQLGYKMYPSSNLLNLDLRTIRNLGKDFEEMVFIRGIRPIPKIQVQTGDRKSTRLNSSH